MTGILTALSVLTALVFTAMLVMLLAEVVEAYGRHQ
jgi:preprotein translocase subunit SecY